MENIYEEHAKVFKAFCDEKRLRILELLRSEEKCACVLLEQLDIGQSGLSYHMKILVESGIVESRQEGKWTHYKISEKGSTYAQSLLKKLTTPNMDTDENSFCK
ncbi:ArsR/SmtB family transcription factor [Oscillospiraceae bacterium LTW-04]|nr:metalloregulator ArsR/SmtB family transcription factor [Oscillospiraceae bacterium MB24-C1]